MPIIIPDNLPYTASGIECLRFGARRGGEGIGCCAIDVLQGFSNDPDEMRPPIPFFDGDSWTPIMKNNGKQLALEGTNEEVLLSYLAHGSFTQEPVADHGFIAVLTEKQVCSSTGKKWLKILYREGFVWAGAVSNGVYSEYHPNHIFMLLRSTNENMEDDEIEALQSPPSFWQSLQGEERASPAQRYRELLGVYQRTHTTVEFELKPEPAVDKETAEKAQSLKATSAAIWTV